MIWEKTPSLLEWSVNTLILIVNNCRSIVKYQIIKLNKKVNIIDKNILKHKNCQLLVINMKLSTIWKPFQIKIKLSMKIKYLIINNLIF